METRHASECLCAPEAGSREGAPVLEHGADARAGRESDRQVRGIVTRLERSIGQGRFERYFHAGTRLRFDPGAPAPVHGPGAPGRLEVVVGSSQVAGVMSRRFAQALREAARDETGRDVEIDIQVDPSSAAAAVETVALASPGAVESAQRSPRPDDREATSRVPRYSLDDFLVGASNRLAHTAALRLADEPPMRRGSGQLPFSTLVLHGPCGVGKTHLLQGAAAHLKRNHPEAVVRCTNGEQFMNEFIASIRTQTVEKFRRTYRRLDLLCIDDVHFLADKKATQEELLHTFDAIDLGGARVIIACDEHPREVKRLSEALVSRFVSGLVARIDPPDSSLRQQIARTFAARRGLTLDDAAARALADPVLSGTSIRDLEGAVTRLEAVVRLMPDLTGSSDGHAGVGLLAVERALGLAPASVRAGATHPRASGRPARPIRIDTIIEAVCLALRVERSDLSGRGRHKRVVLARALVAHLARTLTTLSFPDIARAMFGRPGHSTVITAFQRLARQIESDAPALQGADTMDMSLKELIRRLSDDVRRDR